MLGWLVPPLRQALLPSPRRNEGRRIFPLAQRNPLPYWLCQRVRIFMCFFLLLFYYGFRLGRFPKVFQNRIHGQFGSSVGSANSFCSRYTLRESKAMAGNSITQAKVNQITPGLTTEEDQPNVLLTFRPLCQKLQDHLWPQGRSWQRLRLSKGKESVAPASK